MVGALGTAVHYALLFASVHALGWTAEAATTLGALCGAAINYVLNYRFTFRSRAAHRDTLGKFLAVAGIGILINGAVVAVLTRALGAGLLPGQIAATGLVLVFGFFANRAWTFGAASHE